MNSLAIDRSDGKTRGAAGQPTRCGSIRAPIDHHQSHCRATAMHRRPVGAFLLPRTQSVATLKSGAIYFGAFEEAALRTLILAGIERRAAAANVVSQIGHQASNQFADRAEVVHVTSLSKTTTPAAGVLNGCQQGMPKNWERMPKRRVE